MNVYAKFRNFPLRINKALGIFRKRVTTRTRTTVVVLRDPSGSNDKILEISVCKTETWHRYITYMAHPKLQNHRDLHRNDTRCKVSGSTGERKRV